MGVPALDGSYIMRMDAVKLDIVHAHTPFSAGGAALREVRRLKVPLMYTFHSKYYDDFYVATKIAALARMAASCAARFARRCGGHHRRV